MSDPITIFRQDLDGDPHRDLIKAISMKRIGPAMASALPLLALSCRADEGPIDSIGIDEGQLFDDSTSDPISILRDVFAKIKASGVVYDRIIPFGSPSAPTKAQIDALFADDRRGGKTMLSARIHEDTWRSIQELRAASRHPSGKNRYQRRAGKPWAGIA